MDESTDQQMTDIDQSNNIKAVSEARYLEHLSPLHKNIIMQKEYGNNKSISFYEMLVLNEKTNQNDNSNIDDGNSALNEL